MQNYFDAAATRPISERALNKYIEISRSFPLNPSAIYKGGRDAKDEIERSRSIIANILKVKPRSLIFTSGATESISIVFSTLLWAKKPGRVILSRIEHDAVRSFIPLLKEKGWDVVTVKAKEGFVKAEDLKDALNEETRLVSIMAVNNVNGAIENIKELVKVVREYEKLIKHKIIFFSDSVQALGKAELDLTLSGVDAASFSAHKIAGPRGIGLLYLKDDNKIRALAPAGGQERGFRGGTENTAAISAFAEALAECYEKRDEKNERVKAMSDYLKKEIEEIGLKLNSIGNTTPYIINFSSPLPSEVMMRMLQDRGFFVSAGSACSNNAKKGENIIEAMGFCHERAEHSIRLSLSDENNMDECIMLINAIKEIQSGI